MNTLQGHLGLHSGALLSALFLFCSLAQAQESEASKECLAAYRKAEALWAQGKLTEAVRYYETAVDLAPRAFGVDALDTANMQDNLAQLYMHTGQYPRAEPLLRRSLQTREARLGKQHFVVAQNLNNLAELYRLMGRYHDAEPLYRRSLEIKEAKDPKHPSAALTLNNMALLYKETGQYEKAEAHFQRSRKIFESLPGKPSANLAMVLDNLAQLQVLMGHDEQAEALLQRSLRLFEDSLGADHPDVAICLNNMAFLYHRRLGQLTKAEPLYQRCLAIQEDRVGKESPLVAQTLENLAVLYQAQRQYKRAEQLFLRSLKIRRARLPANHPDLGQSLNDLAFLYDEMGDYDRAEPLYQESLKVYEAKLGRDDPQVAAVLNNLGLLNLWMGRPGDAERILQCSLRIRESKLGLDHPEVALNLGHLALLHAGEEHWDKALKATDRDLRILRRHSSRVLSVLPEREQLAFLSARVRGEFAASLSLGLVQATGAQGVEFSTSWVLNGKGMAEQTVAERTLLARDARDSEVSSVVQRLMAVRRQLATLTWKDPFPWADGLRRKELGRLAEEEQELSRQLGQRVGRLRDDPWVKVAEVRKTLPPDGVLVEVARFSVRNFQAKSKTKHWQAPRYVAWVIPPTGKGDMQVIDLGRAEEIDQAVQKFRQAMRSAGKTIYQEGEADAEELLKKDLQAIAQRVLVPLLHHIGDRQRWLISPDASLWLVPWATLPLPDGRYVIEKHQIRYLVSGRDLVARPSQADAGPGLVLADPDFDLDPARAAEQIADLKIGAERAQRGASRTSNDRIPTDWPRLPGTAQEVQTITPKLTAYLGAKPQVYTREKALETICKASHRPRVLVLSTHGYFLQDQERKPEESASGRDQQWFFRGKLLENPLLRCGMVLAGANQRERIKDSTEDDGLLTGLEILQLDLRGTELVVLSACDTGVGDVLNGEGVAGLRQAFQLAGAQAVVASLWKVPDAETARLMAGFWQELAKDPDRSEALRRAQLAVIKARREGKGKAAHPYFWAAFTLTGQRQPPR